MSHVPRVISPMCTGSTLVNSISLTTHILHHMSACPLLKLKRLILFRQSAISLSVVALNSAAASLQQTVTQTFTRHNGFTNAFLNNGQNTNFLVASQITPNMLPKLFEVKPVAWLTRHQSPNGSHVRFAVFRYSGYRLVKRRSERFSEKASDLFQVCQ